MPNNHGSNNRGGHRPHAPHQMRTGGAPPQHRPVFLLAPATPACGPANAPGQNDILRKTAVQGTFSHRDQHPLTPTRNPCHPRQTNHNHQQRGQHHAAHQNHYQQQQQQQAAASQALSVTDYSRLLDLYHPSGPFPISAAQRQPTSSSPQQTRSQMSADVTVPRFNPLFDPSINHPPFNPTFPALPHAQWDPAQQQITEQRIYPTNSFQRLGISAYPALPTSPRYAPNCPPLYNTYTSANAEYNVRQQDSLAAYMAAAAVEAEAAVWAQSVNMPAWWCGWCRAGVEDGWRVCSSCGVPGPFDWVCDQCEGRNNGRLRACAECGSERSILRG